MTHFPPFPCEQREKWRKPKAAKTHNFQGSTPSTLHLTCQFYSSKIPLHKSNQILADAASSRLEKSGLFFSIFKNEEFHIKIR